MVMNKTTSIMTHIARKNMNYETWTIEYEYKDILRVSQEESQAVLRKFAIQIV